MNSIWCRKCDSRLIDIAQHFKPETIFPVNWHGGSYVEEVSTLLQLCPKCLVLLKRVGGAFSESLIVTEGQGLFRIRLECKTFNGVPQYWPSGIAGKIVEPNRLAQPSLEMGKVTDPMDRKIKVREENISIMEGLETLKKIAEKALRMAVDSEIKKRFYSLLYSVEEAKKNLEAVGAAKG